MWEFFTAKEIFKNEPNDNLRPLEGKNKADIDEILDAARQIVGIFYSSFFNAREAVNEI